MRIFITFGLALAVILGSITADAADKNERRREKINTMASYALDDLFEQRPQARREIEEAEGYAVFSNVGVQFFLIGGGGGSGVAVDQRTGERTFMRMAQGKIGLGLGVKDFRAIFIFHTREPFESFLDKGWDFSGEADAAAQFDDVSGERSEGSSVRRRVTLYQFTENGLALSASLNGTKYWKSKKLNAAGD